MRTQEWLVRLLSKARVAHLATATRFGKPHVVPICYAFNGKTIYSSLDQKPKQVAFQRLRRVRNIAANPRVCLVVDTYSEDWLNLRYVIVHGFADVIRGGIEHRLAAALLRRKYSQYGKMRIEELPVIRIRPTRISAWQSNQQG